MIDYIKFTVDGKDYYLVQNPDGSWEKSVTAPSVVGRYDLTLEIVKDGIVTVITSSDPRYNFYLNVMEEAEQISRIQDYVPKFMSDIMELKVIYQAENAELDNLYMNMVHLENNAFIRTASIEIILQLENFLGVKGMGTLQQRKDYLIALMQKGKKLNEGSIKEIANTITGSDCIVTFYAGSELDNPQVGNGFIRVQVLSPEQNKDYRYEDIYRTLKPMVPAHVKLIVEKYFALWQDIADNFADWGAVYNQQDWQAIKNYIPPQ